MHHNRPLSPHLQVYRWQITSVLSILHRLTGIGLAFASLFLIIWLGSIAYGQSCWEFVMSWYTLPVGKGVLVAILFGFYYHLANGIRHLFWDSGRGFDISTATKSGWIVIFIALIFTVFTTLRMI